jgi:hypothetical protein
MNSRWVALTLAAALLAAPVAQAADGSGEGSLPYEKFETTETCADCHSEIARQHARSLMAQSFTHEWDEIEYFELALPHALKNEKVAGVKSGCNGCHAPLAYLAGDIPPKHPSEGTRANEGVSCDVCHSITGFSGDVPFNFNYTMAPGTAKQGTRPGMESEYHEIAVNEFLASGEFCGICHNEKDPFGVWVKATHLEWKEGPYASAGITCQKCHMPPADGTLSDGGPEVKGVRRHTFHGVHFPEKLNGAVEVLLYPRESSVATGGVVVVDATVMNAKAGHMIPSGSVEERVVWMHVEATDSGGKKWHLPVDRKGFEGEDWTIADPAVLSYQDIGDIRGIDKFPGLARDGDVPAGDRIFRMPYLDPAGRMTIAQWNTASLGPDYRLPPLQAMGETFTWQLPPGVAKGEATIRATVYMTRVVSSVVDYMKIPATEKEPTVMGQTEVTLLVR